MSSTTLQSPPQTTEFDLTIDDAAAVAQTTERTIRRWMTHGHRHRGVLRAVRTVHGIRISSDDLAAYIRPVALDHQPAPTGSTAPDPEAELDAAVARVLASAPALSAEQRRKLGHILGSAR